MICCHTVLIKSCNCKVYRLRISEAVVEALNSSVVILKARNRICPYIVCECNLPSSVCIVVSRDNDWVIIVAVSVICCIRSLREAYETEVVLHILPVLTCLIGLTGDECTCTIYECFLPVVPLCTIRLWIIVLCKHINSPVESLKCLICLNLVDELSVCILADKLSIVWPYSLLNECRSEVNHCEAVNHTIIICILCNLLTEFLELIPCPIAGLLKIVDWLRLNSCLA